MIMEIFALIGQNPIPAIIVGIVICIIVAAFKNKHTKNYFCTDCGYVVGVQFHIGNDLFRTYKPCPRCGNNVASPFNTGQGRTHRQGGRNY
jgi:ribosomal protein S27AE